MRTIHKLLLFNMGGSGGSGINYLLRDEFITAEAAPLATPRNAEPGPGTLTIVQADGEFSISSDRLAFPAQSTPVLGDLGFRSTAGLARVAGRVLLCELIQTVSARSDICWHNATILSDASKSAMLIMSGGALIVRNQSGQVVLPLAYSSSISYQIAIVHRDIGAVFLIKGGAFTDWRLLFVLLDASDATMYPLFTNNDAVGTMGYFRVRDLGGVFLSDYGIATVRDTTLASGDIFTGTADGIHDFEITLEADPDAADEVSLNVRWQDIDNKIRAILRRNAGDTAWDFQVRVVTAGTPATPSGWTDVTGVGTPDAIRVIASGTSLAFYTKSGTAWTKRGATLTNSSFQAEAGLEIEAAAGTTLTAVTSYPRTSSNYNVLDQV